ncbi:helix-turn-helix transcriptional regulator [Ferrimonas marina]|uniref:DNA-binding response regulator, NarL/FixJ family, contains REC and HTH domains n=1 Tax=Ferrimonas marina TaxID=299255 RepID=A0A1M5VJM9_9GAMM|nr:response regulator transcription factor [Ferrimonas marina]SHH75123.1 DNA-binding response regulator, NarL/FixJ family, contains REC and HTH domains [Ferrimonas marina]
MEMDTATIVLFSQDRAFSQVASGLLSATGEDYNLICLNTFSSFSELEATNGPLAVLVDWKSMPNPGRHGLVPRQENGEWLAINAEEGEVEDVSGWIELGYVGILPASRCLELLCKAVRVILNGELWYPRSEISRALRAYQQGGFNPQQLSGVLAEQFSLTSREREICHMLLKGLSNGQIARQGNISIHTVKTHVSNLMQKMEVNSRKELMARVMTETRSHEVVPVWS